MNKEDIIKQCNEDIDRLSMILHEKKIDTRLVSIEHITPIINKYISLAYDMGGLNNNTRTYE